MRKSFFLLALLVFFSFSCVEENNPETQGGTTVNEKITLLSSEIVLSEKEQIAVFEFESSVAWTIEPINDRASEWCSVEPLSGDAGKASVVVSVNENLDYNDRQAVWFIRAGKCSEKVVVSQKQKDALTVTSSRFEISSDGGIVDVEVKTNVDFEYHITDSADEWLHNVQTKALESHHLTFSVDENYSTTPRSASIYIISSNFMETISVYQDGTIVQFPTAMDLSSTETSNCYILSASGVYKFKTVQGNSNTSVGNVARVEVLWESFGTDVVPSVGDLIKSVSYEDGYIAFQTADTFKEGNAIIAAMDADGTILWSWHIWLTDEPEGQVYYNGAGTMMDRNLGATSATPGDVGALGLLYQWGRKDPFLGSSSISSGVEAKSTISWPSPVSSSSSRGTIVYAVEHPTTFITRNDSNHDWYYTGSSSTDNIRWQSEKTISDPCPAGWRVPDGDSNGVWNKAGFDDQNYDRSDKGMLFGSGISSPATWYPASGHRDDNDGSLYSVGNSGIYWSVTPYGNDAYSLFFDPYGNVHSTYSFNRANGQSVRCIHE